MTEIHIERKQGKGWLWALLAVIALALAAWWLFAGSDDDGRTTAALDTAAVPAAAAPMVDADANAVQDFVAWVGSTDAASDAGVRHEHTADGVRRLAGAIGALARGDSLGGAGVDEQVTALGVLADRLQTEAQSLKHADLAHAAFASAATLLGDVQQRRFPNAGAQVAPVRQAAESIRKDRPLLEQRAEIDRFFTTAADAVRAMSGGGA